MMLRSPVLRTAFMCVFMSMWCVTVTARTHEPSCTSKFDYDYKMLTKIIELERQQTELLAALKKQQAVVEELQTEREDFGSTYTIWGKKTCPANGSNEIYSGYMAGGYRNTAGSGSNYLCLSDQPEWLHFEDKLGDGGRIYGTEYQFYDHRSDGAIKFLGQNVYNKNAPCAVCHITRGSTIMIPGRTTCMSGWRKEYGGYLVSGYYGHKQASQYVCLDAAADVLVGNQNDDDENMIYFVEGVCGKSLPCPPYVNGREITCVVCSLSSH